MGRISRQAWQNIVLVPECASAGGQCFRQGRFGFVGTFQTRIEGERVKPNIGAAALAASAPTMRRMVKNEP